MRFLATIAFLSILFVSCSQDRGGSGTNDTITTASGLKYFYLKKGDGQKVDTLSEVKAYLSLSIDDSVVWNTNESPDSLFTYIAGYSQLIQGFTEVSYYLRQGDEVVVIIPSDLAYGPAGAGGVIPPNATVVYDKFEVRSVSAPKGMLSDTLFLAFQVGGSASAIAKYEDIIAAGDSANYFMGLDQVYSFWQTLAQQNLFDEALKIAEYFSKDNEDMQLRFFKVISLENLDKIQPAIDECQKMIDDDGTGNQFLLNKLAELKSKL